MWHAGKTLEATWILGGVASVAALLYWWGNDARDEGADHALPRWLWMTGVAFVGVTFLSYLFSSAKNYGFDEVMRDSAYVLLFFWLARTGRDERVPDASAPGPTFGQRLLITLTVAAVTACLIGIAVYVLQSPNRFVGTFFDARFNVDYWPNAWAEFALLCWPAAAVVLRRKLWLQVPALGLLIGCLFLSYSRGGFLAFVFQLVLWGGILGLRAYMRRVPGKPVFAVRHPRRSIITVASVLALAVVLFLCVNQVRSVFHPVQSVGAKVTFSAAEGNSSVTERSQFWHQAYALAMQRPLLGWGPYAFRFVQPRLQTGVYETSDHPHNVFLKLAMERGFPAAALFALIVLWVLFASVRAYVRPDPASSTRIALFPDEEVIVPAIVAVAGVLAHNQIDYNLQFVAIALPFWLLLGFLASRLARPAGKGVGGKTAHRTEATIAVAVLCLLFLEGRYLLLSSAGRHAEAAGDQTAALHAYDASRGELFSRDLHLSRATIHMSRGELREAGAALQDYLGQNAEDPRVWKLLGDVELAKNDRAKALKDYNQAWKLGAYDYVSVLGGILRILEDQKDAKTLLARKTEFETVYRTFGDAIIHNTHFIALSPNVEEFGAIADQMQRLYPADAASYKDLAVRAKAAADRTRKELGNQSQGLLW
jgi:O-antigen ligase